MTNSELRELIVNDLEFVRSMSVKEYTLYRKWLELNSDKFKYTPEQLQEVKDNIWIPKMKNDYLKLEPELINCTKGKEKDTWNILRKCVSTAHWLQSPGRLLYFYVRDKNTGKYLGVMSIASDFLAIGGRDKYIGWTKEDKITNHMVNHTAMASTIVPTQPLGYNYLGGKLISLLVLSDTVEQYWNEKYKEKLVGVTTTSLYGGYSQYNNLKYWRKCDSTEGKLEIEPSNEVYDQMRFWLKENYPDKYMSFFVNEKSNSGITSHTKVKIISFVMSKLKIKRQENNFSRGVYFARLYENTNNFLSRNTNELIGHIDNKVGTLSILWKEKYAKKRINKLFNDKKANNTSLFYNDIIGLSWDETKQLYLGDEIIS